jgi:hypothetical protein
MASPPHGVRYSQGNKDIGAARRFAWEHPVPQNKFWDDLPFTVARNFLSLFTSEEDPPPSFNDDTEHSELSREDKLRLLLQLLHDRLARLDAGAAPQSLYDVNYLTWDRTWLAVAGIQHELGDLAGQEQTLRMLIKKRKDASSLSHLHSLSGLLLEQGRYAEAKNQEAAVREWLDGKLGREAPQSLSARRIIAQAVWMQGRRDEAERLIAEIVGDNRELRNSMAFDACASRKMSRSGAGCRKIWVAAPQQVTFITWVRQGHTTEIDGIVRDWLGNRPTQLCLRPGRAQLSASTVRSWATRPLHARSRRHADGALSRGTITTHAKLQ